MRATTTSRTADTPIFEADHLDFEELARSAPTRSHNPSNDTHSVSREDEVDKEHEHDKDKSNSPSFVENPNFAGQEDIEKGDQRKN